MPVYVLLIGTFFAPNQRGNILFAIYLLGIVIGIASAKLLKSTVLQGLSEPFVMELPRYRLPNLNSIFIHLFDRTILYLQRAGTIILLFSVLVWVLCNFPQVKIPQKNAAAYQQSSSIEGNHLKTSYAGMLGQALDFAAKPLGFDYHITIALIAGIAGKEIIVSSLATQYSIENSGNASLSDKLRTDRNFSPIVALTLAVFVLLYTSCVASIIVFRRESGSLPWTIVFVLYPLILAWVVAFITKIVFGAII
jgi:ferrous iron transport protein B